MYYTSIYVIKQVKELVIKESKVIRKTNEENTEE